MADLTIPSFLLDDAPPEKPKRAARRRPNDIEEEELEELRYWRMHTFHQGQLFTSTGQPLTTALSPMAQCTTGRAHSNKVIPVEDCSCGYHGLFDRQRLGLEPYFQGQATYDGFQTILLCECEIVGKAVVGGIGARAQQFKIVRGLPLWGTRKADQKELEKFCSVTGIEIG